MELNYDEEMELEEAMLLYFALGVADNVDGGNVDDPKWVNVPVDTRAFQIMGDPAFQLHFRMSRVTFEVLHEVLGRHMFESSIIQRITGYDVDLILMHTLWILATPDSYRSVAMQFNTTPSTVYRHFTKVIEALCELAPRYIKWPSQEERGVIANAFEAYSGVPGIVGAVDGTYMVMNAPTVQPRRYIDRHHQYSMNTQAVCDHNLVVRDLHVGEAGALTDARVFRRSPLCRQLLTNPDKLEANQHIIGDSIYMLTDKLLTPIRNNGRLTRAQKAYNYRLCRCRARIEHCFGKLFSQWRRLKFLESYNFECAVKTIVACFVLHNFMILEGHEVHNVIDPVEPDDDVIEDEDDMAEQLLEGDYDNLPEEFLQRNPHVRLLQQARVAGRRKRDELVEHFSNQINRNP